MTIINRQKLKSRQKQTITIRSVQGGVSRLIRTLVFASFLIWVGIYLRQFDLPDYVSTVIFFVAPLMILLDLVTIRSMIRAEREDAIPHIDGHLFDDETIQSVISAVAYYQDNSLLELPGELSRPHHENMLVMTNRALWALNVPYKYEEEDMFGTDAGIYQWLNEDEDIYEDFEKLKAKLPLEELFRVCRAKKLIDHSEILDVNYLPNHRVIRFQSKGGEHCSYMIKKESDYEQAKTTIDHWEKTLDYQDESLFEPKQ